MGQSREGTARPAGRPEDTLPKLLLRDYQQWGNNHLALRKKQYGIWQGYTWKDCYERTKAICLGLTSLGLGHGENACILGDSNPEWFWSELAVQAAGGVVVGLDSGSSVEETKGLVALTRAKFVLAQDQEQVDKILESKEALPSLQRLIVWRGKGLRHYSDPLLLSLDDLLRLGGDCDRKDPGQFERQIAKGKGTDVAALLFTRGASGASRAVPATHGFLISSAAGAVANNTVSGSDDYVSIFSPGWFFEQVLGFGACLLTGQRLNFAETPDTVPMDSREISPQIVLYPSGVWETMVEAIRNNMKSGNWLKRAMYDRSLSIGYRRADRLNRGSKMGLRGSILSGIADVLALRALRDKHGLNRARIAYAAGGTLSSETSRYLMAIAVDIKQVFGSTKDGVVPAPPLEEISIA